MDTKASVMPAVPFPVRSFDGPLGRNIIETHIWAVREGLRGASAYDLFDGYCQRLVIHGVPLWRARAAMETLHPQWSGYGYTWRRDSTRFSPSNMRAVTSPARNG
jgi:adenylate cyclase